MSQKDGDNEGLDMVTFQPYEEEVPQNKKEDKKAASPQPSVVKNKNSAGKNDAIKGVVLGVGFAFLFIVVDFFLHR